MTAARVGRRSRAVSQWRWLIPGMGVKRYVLVFALGIVILLFGF